MRSRSLKRQRQIREYIPLAEAFLADNPTCQHPTNHPLPVPSTVVHHQRGRRGLRLLDRDWWAASCALCNAEAEDDTGTSLACGWLVPIEGVQR